MSELSVNIDKTIDEDGYNGDTVATAAQEEKQMEQLVPDLYIDIDGTDDMDLANAPNPWLPAYGFQIQHQHSNFQPTHEDLRANDVNLVQQVDFLETILEETSDDLQSDSDRSGTTYWLGSDSETESVIHIKSNQRAAADRPDGSGSECNSVVPKKRRRRNGAGDSDSYVHLSEWASPRSSRSSASSRSSKSSRSSSLKQFETLERTCATVSPSGYSYDSLEYSNRSNSHFENTSPDSLEEEDDTDDDDDRTLTNVKRPSFSLSNSHVEFPKIRPFRSFESLGTNQKTSESFDQEIGHGFLFAKTTSNDLSECDRRSAIKRNDYWYAKCSGNYDYEEDSEDLEDDDDDEDDGAGCQYAGALNDHRGFLTFPDTVNNGYSTSLDFRNTIDLREIGLEPVKHETILDLARSQIGSTTGLLHPKLNITSNMASGIASGQHDQHQRGWSNSETYDFNFRMTNKSRSVPGLSSLASSTDISVSASLLSRYNHNYDSHYNYPSSLNLSFDNYTRVASLPVNINLCGSDNVMDGDETVTLNNRIHEMADETMSVNESSGADEVINSRELPKRTSSVRTQKLLNNQHLHDLQIENTAEPATVASASPNDIHENDIDMKDEMSPLNEPTTNDLNTKILTVKTQDPGNHVLEMARAMENDIDSVVDEAIKQLKRQVEEATNSPGNVTFAKDHPRQRKIKNNASYELAQQWQVDEENFQFRMKSCIEAADESSPTNSPTRRRVHNNASYELAQQSDYIKALQSMSRPFQRMDACDELPEFSSRNLSQQPRNSPIVLDNGNGQFNDRDTAGIIARNKYSPLPNYGKQEESHEQIVQQDSIIDQIKKNSEIFSIYGEGASASGVDIDDEVDLPCLETKPIDGEINVNNYVRRGINQEATGDRNPPERVTLSFLSDFYPDQSNEVVSKMNSDSNNSIFKNEVIVNGETKMALCANDDDDGDGGGGGGCEGGVMPGERLWRVVVEQENSIFGMDGWGSKEEVDNVEKEEEETVVVETQRLVVDDTSQASEYTVVSVSSSSVSVETSDNKTIPGLTDESPDLLGVNKNIDNRSSSSSLEKGADTSTPCGEMSAIAAKRLAMGPMQSSSPRNSQLLPSNNDPTVVTMPIGERKKSGLGGFLQRFSKLRFSGRSKVPRSEVKRSESDGIIKGKAHKENDDTQQSLSIKRKKEPDYIIIPLHPPQEEKIKDHDHEDSSQPKRTDLERSASSVGGTGRPPVCMSKPPLPPLAPQGVRACAASPRATSGVVNTRRRATTDLGSPAVIEMAKARAMQQQQQHQQHYHNHHHQLHQVVHGHQEERPVGLLETDLDDETVNVDVTSKNLTDQDEGDTLTVGGRGSAAPGKKTRSLLNLNHTCRQGRDSITENINALRVPQSPGAACRNTNDHPDHSSGTINHRPHKSMEFLLDKENLHFIKPPENELQKVGERVPSEHELRVQRSLQRLNVPDWYKNSPAARDGFRLKRHSDASQHGGWRSLGSKTTSLSSLSSSSNRQPATATTGLLLSPSPTPPVFSRWSTSLLNSAGSSPANSARSSFNHRQPYLGWRSQERLANPRTPAERLAQGILPQVQNAKKQQQQTNQQIEVRNSIKEVTSAIVHYVQSGQEVVASGVGDGSGGRLSPRPRLDEPDDRGGARSTSPRGSVKLCWMESSFVGSRRVDSPETPMSLATDTECCTGCNTVGTESCSCMDSATSGLYLDLTPTRDEPTHQKGDYDQQTRSTTCLCPSPSTSHYHQQKQHRYTQQRHHRGSGQSEDDEAMATVGLLHNKPSPGSTTLEDVLDSLLGLPPASRTPSPGPGPITTGSGSSSMRHHRTGATAQSNTKTGKSCSDLRQDLQECANKGAPESPTSCPDPRVTSYNVGGLVQRRKSEGSDIVPPHRLSCRSSSNVRNRRVSFDSGQENPPPMAADKLVKCRNHKCSNSTSLAEAKRLYKSCHNCNYLYCSKECRRAHWPRHRRTCLHYRAGTLCRQVLSSAKEDPATIKHISALAKRGYAAHGRGAVKCFFTSPETAEQFIGNGFKDFGEPTYVRCSDLLTSEMGAELYAEIMRLCKTYNPETRLVLFVAVCVVSEVPSSGAVRWERQLVSRCGKIRLDPSQRTVSSVISPSQNKHQIQPSASTVTTIPLQSSPSNHPAITREMDSPETLVLTSLPDHQGQNTTRRTREIGFTNIQRQLRQRGVSLRRHFPQVYMKLSSYVDGTVDKFAPVTIYPRDQASGKSFMCIIMLDAEPERLQLLPTDSSRVRTVDISVEQE
ncbi:uncharacterized protein LOC135166102 isoform X2 [Diachasmimorpha longicaudata]|uniref:uncharacterized protein LOC135166102 isoform X2 n=1 Tax=Diachasmimorpha longicaudata TaxID=58733 RepID=UPI0030B897B7